MDWLELKRCENGNECVVVEKQHELLEFRENNMDVRTALAS